MLHNPFHSLTRKGWLLWLASLAVVIAGSLVGGTPDLLSLVATLIGVTALAFMATGDVWGQLLTALFGILYGIAAIRVRYWSEVITYIGMSAPMALAAAVSWLRHPYQGSTTVEIHHLSRRDIRYIILLTLVATVVFGSLLALVHTPRLPISILSVTTSFLACALTWFRSPLYAVAYACNDLVLIVLWALQAFTDPSAWGMAACFVMFFLNDAYAYVSWQRRAIHQMTDSRGKA